MTRDPEIHIDGAFAKSATFLAGLGFRIRHDPHAEGFLTGVAIDKGALVVARPDDDLACELLHEAGHLAVLPSMFRNEASGDLHDVSQLMSDWIDGHLAAVHPDDPRIRAILQSGECEAVAWSYAAALGFDDEGLALHDQVASGYYFGVHGLAAGGMTDLPRPYLTLPFPRMKRWLQI